MLSISRFNRNVNSFLSQIKFYSKYKPLKVQKTLSNESAERNYARQVMRTRKQCALFDFNSNRQHFEITTEKVMTVNVANEFDNDELVKILSKFAIKRTNAKALTKWNQQCIEMYPKWTTRKQLYVLDIWYFIRDSFDSPFVQKVLSNLLNHIEKIHEDQAMQTLIYLGWSHRRFNKIETERVQRIFRKIIDREKLDVLSVWNVSLYRTEMDLDDDLVQILYQRLINEDIQHLSDIGLNSFIKALRFKREKRNYALAIELMPKLRERSKSCDLLLTISICRLLCRCRVYDEILMNHIINRINENIDSLRYKDMEWICYTTSFFYIISKNQNAKKMLFNICQHLINDGKSSYQSTIIRCIHYMLLAGFHDRKLLNWALSPATLKAAYTCVENYDTSVIHIDGFAKIVLSGKYEGNRLITKDVITVAKKNISNEDSYFLNEIKSIMEKSGQEAVIIHSLPHFNVPSLFQLRNSLNDAAIPIKVKLPQFGSIVTATHLTGNDKNLSSIAFMISKPHNYIHNTKQFTGHFRMKIKQLRCAGHDVAVIPIDSKWKTSDIPTKIQIIERAIRKDKFVNNHE